MRRPDLRTSATPRRFSSSAIRCDSAERVTPSCSAASVSVPSVANSDSADSARAEGCTEAMSSLQLVRYFHQLRPADKLSFGLSPRDLANALANRNQQMAIENFRQ